MSGDMTAWMAVELSKKVELAVAVQMLQPHIKIRKPKDVNARGESPHSLPGNTVLNLAKKKVLDI